MANIICPKCSTANPAENLFCQSCGASLKGVKPAAGDKTVRAQRKPSAVAAPAAPVTPPAIKTSTPPPIASAPPALKTTTPPPVAPPPPVPAYAPAVYGTPIRRLGSRIDSWSEVIDNSAAAADAIAGEFLQEIEGLKVEGIRAATSDLTSGSSGLRKYQVVTNGRGATVAVRFAPMGKDLYFNWDLYVHRPVNWLVIGIAGGIAFLLALFMAIDAGTFLYGLLTFFTTFFNLLLVPGLGLLLFGKLLKDDIWGFYLNSPDDFALDDANALSILVDDAATRAIETSMDETGRSQKSKK